MPISPGTDGGCAMNISCAAPADDTAAHYLELTETIARCGSYRRHLKTGASHGSPGMYRIFGRAPGAVRPGFD